MPRRVSLPSSLPLGHTRVRLEVTEAVGDEAHGDYSAPIATGPRIRVHRAASPTEQLNTVLHELVHAAWAFDELGEEGDKAGREERIARCVGNRIAEAIIRSPQLRRWIGSLRP